MALGRAQVRAAGLTCMKRARQPASVTTSDLLQSAPVSEQQEIPRIRWRVSPSLGRLSFRWSVRSMADFRSTLATTFPYSGHMFRTWNELFFSTPRFFHQALRHSESLWSTLFPALHEASAVPVGSSISATARTATARIPVRKVLASAIPELPCDPGGASQKDALPNQVGRPAAATRRIFQWGLLEINMSSPAPDLPTTVELNSTRQVGPSPGQIQRTPPRVGRIMELHRFPVPGTARSSG